jgi:hypothetical protein
VGLVVTLFGAMFWAAVGIAIFHIAMSYIAPTRFQRLGAMWDAVERAKDIAIGLAVLFAIFYGIMAAGAVITGNFSTEKAWDLFVKIVSKPLVDLYQQIINALSPQTGTSPRRTIARPMAQPNFFSDLSLDPLFLSGLAVLSAQALYYVSLWFIGGRSQKERAMEGFEHVILSGVLFGVALILSTCLCGVSTHTCL